MSETNTPEWLLVFDQTLSFGDRTELPLLGDLTSAHLLYEATYNYNLPRIGFLVHLEQSSLGETVIDRYTVFARKNLLEVKPGVAETYSLRFAPGFAPIAPVSINLKIWRPTMPLSRSGGSATLTPVTSSATTASSVTSTTTSTTILAANENRKGSTIWNASTATLYLDLDSASDAVASATDYTVALAPGDYYETPYGYTGKIVGVWSEANGNALVREFV